jgi:integrase
MYGRVQEVSSSRAARIAGRVSHQVLLQLTARHPLHCARDHWAVRAARAGTPVAIIQAQLGHGSPMLTLTKYGRFLPRPLIGRSGRCREPL